MSVKVAVTDSQFLTRRGIVHLIGSLPDFETVKEIESIKQLESTIEVLSLDLVVLEVLELDDGLISLLSKTKDVLSANFLILYSGKEKRLAQQLVDLGIKGIITKNCSEEEVTNALYAVSKGERFFCNKILDLMFTHQGVHENPEPIGLSPREFEVLKLIGQGNTSSKIADELFLSVHTINSHRKSILKKLNMKSPAELIVYAIQNGLVKNS